MSGITNGSIHAEGFARLWVSKLVSVPKLRQVYWRCFLQDGLGVAPNIFSDVTKMKGSVYANHIWYTS